MTSGPPPFRHVLLTRFNAPLATGALGRDPAWLEHRLAVFEAVCAPSVARQTARSFTWSVFCDARTPAPYAERLEALAARFGFRTVWSDRPFDAAVAGDHVRALLGPARHVVTTRLDSDDALAPEFVELVQRRFRSQERAFVNFPLGYQLHRGELYLRLYLGSPFLSLVERVGDVPSTVFAAEHWRPDLHRAEQCWTRKPAWLQVVHEHNLANQVRGLWVRPQGGSRFELPAPWLTTEPLSPLGAAVRRTRSVRRALGTGDGRRRLDVLVRSARQWRWSDDARRSSSTRS